MIENTGGDASGFAELALAPELRHALSGLGYEEPTPIQRAAIPPLLEGRDLVGQAATGTGKTAAFALPVLQRLLREGGRVEPLALVLVPTRELAVQVSEAMHRYGRDIGARVLPIYGGQLYRCWLLITEAGECMAQFRGQRQLREAARTPAGILDHERPLGLKAL